MDAISADFEDAAASPQATQSTGASATMPVQTATPAPTMTPEVSATPLPTPVPTLTPAPTSVQIGYDAVILQYDVSGITEDEAYQMFGQPISRDLVEYPDSTDVFLTYDTFILKFYNEDDTTTNCYEVQIISTPCPIDVFGLEIGMGTADVEAEMAGSPFELDYQEEDGSYWVYSNLMTGQNIFVDFIDGTVIDFSVFYSP